MASCTEGKHRALCADDDTSGTGRGQGETRGHAADVF
jgi:hypothetical protein